MAADANGKSVGFADRCVTTPPRGRLRVRRGQKPAPEQHRGPLYRSLPQWAIWEHFQEKWNSGFPVRKCDPYQKARFRDESARPKAGWNSGPAAPICGRNECRHRERLAFSAALPQEKVASIGKCASLRVPGFPDDWICPMIDFVAARRIMVDSQVRTSDVTDSRLIAAMLALPRERFLPAEQAELAYLDFDIPVAAARAGAPPRRLLKPMVLAKLLQAAEIAEGDHVLDVGCATGYASAVMAR